MRPELFIEAVKRLDLAEVLDRQDDDRVRSPSAQAVKDSDRFILVGFRVRAPMVRIVWAIIEVVPVGQLTRDELPPGLPPTDSGWEAWDLKLDGVSLVQGPTGEPYDINDAKPPGRRDQPAVIVPYPGRVSWEKLRQTAERLVY